MIEIHIREEEEWRMLDRSSMFHERKKGGEFLPDSDPEETIWFRIELESDNDPSVVGSSSSFSPSFSFPSVA